MDRGLRRERKFEQESDSKFELEGPKVDVAVKQTPLTITSIFRSGICWCSRTPLYLLVPALYITNRFDLRAVVRLARTRSFR